MKYIFITILLLMCGCKSIQEVEFYEPTKSNTDYCVKQTDKYRGHGPVKRVVFGSGLAGKSTSGLNLDFNLVNL